MGARLVALAEADKGLNVVASLTRASNELTSTPQVLIDFTSPEHMHHWIKVCRAKKIAMVIGTTGLKPEDHKAIDEAAKDIAVLQAPNMSLGVNLLFKIAAQMAKTLGDDYDIEIVEGHHRLKKDAPSGTAAGIASAMIKATGKTDDAIVYGRQGDEVLRKRGEIGMHSMRLGDEVGRHTVFFATMGERLELSHFASSRDTFALGALKAAKWLAGKKPGRYGMENVLGLA